MSNTHGISKLIIVVILAVAILVVGGALYYLSINNSNTTSNTNKTVSCTTDEDCINFCGDDECLQADCSGPNDAKPYTCSCLGLCGAVVPTTINSNKAIITNTTITNTTIINTNTLLEIGDERKFSHEDDGYSVTVPDGWYAHELDTGTIFLKTDILPEVEATEEYEYGAQYGIIRTSMSDVPGAESADDYLDSAVGLTDPVGNPILRGGVVVEGKSFIRVTVAAANAQGIFVSYFHFNGDTVYQLYNYPYSGNSTDSQNFLEMVKSFVIL